MEKGNQHFRYQRSCSIVVVIVSAFLFLYLHIVYLDKQKTEYFTALLLYFIFNTPNNDNNTTIILELSRYPDH